MLVLILRYLRFQNLKFNSGVRFISGLKTGVFATPAPRLYNRGCIDYYILKEWEARMTRCDKCNARSVIFQRYSGMHLCRSHFDEDVHRKVREALRETGIFGKGAKLAIGLDGGKSSSAMLYILKNLFSRRRDIKMVAVLVDEGIFGYRSEMLANARSLAERLEIPHITKSFKDAYKATTDEIAAKNSSGPPCTFCRDMKSALLNRSSLELKADVLVTGDTLDREAQTIMQSYLRGEVDRIFTLQQQYRFQGMVPVIKPLRRVPEREVALYAVTHDLSPSDSCPCPYIGDPMRQEVKKSLEDFEGKHPGTKYSLLRSMERLVKLKP